MKKINKIYLFTLLLKLLKIKKQLGNPLSSILGCKSYIFDEQFNTTDKKKQLDALLKLKPEIKNREELTSYNPKVTEEILLWFQTNKCKTPMEKLIIENIEYCSSYEWLQMVNESSIVQNILHYLNLILTPAISTSLICVIIFIIIYYLFIINFKLKFPLNSYINIIKNSILIRNNFLKIILLRVKDAKYIIYIGLIAILSGIAFHVYNIYQLLKDTEILYKKIKLFKRQIQQMENISQRLCESQNDTVNYFIEHLKANEEEFYERSINKWFLLLNRGRIISDYFKISNKKNKLGKLFQLNGMCSYMKLN